MPPPQMSASWWKKHRALLAKDVGLEKALKTYETAKTHWDRRPSDDSYEKVINTLIVVSKAADDQAKYCERTKHHKTQEIAEGYPGVVKAVSDQIMKAYKDYRETLKKVCGKWEALVALAMDLNLRCAEDEKKAVALAKTFDKACWSGKGRRHKGLMDDCLERLQAHLAKTEKLEKGLNEASLEKGRYPAPDIRAILNNRASNPIDLHIIGNALNRSITNLQTAIDSKSDDEVNRMGADYEKKLEEYKKKVNEAVKSDTDFFKAVADAGKLADKLKPDMRNFQQHYDTLKDEINGFHDNLTQVIANNRIVQKKGEDFDEDDIKDLQEKRNKLTLDAGPVLRTILEMEMQINRVRVEYERGEKERRDYEVFRNGFQQKVLLLQKAIPATRKRLQTPSQDTQDFIKAVKKHPQMDKSGASELNDVIKGIFNHNLELERDVSELKDQLPKLNKDDISKQKTALIALEKMMGQTKAGCEGLMGELTPYV